MNPCPHLQLLSLLKSEMRLLWSTEAQKDIFQWAKIPLHMYAAKILRTLKANSQHFFSSTTLRPWLTAVNYVKEKKEKKQHLLPDPALDRWVLRFLAFHSWIWETGSNQWGEQKLRPEHPQTTEGSFIYLSVVFGPRHPQMVSAAAVFSRNCCWFSLLFDCVQALRCIVKDVVLVLVMVVEIVYCSSDISRSSISGCCGSTSIDIFLYQVEKHCPNLA